MSNSLKVAVLTSLLGMSAGAVMASSLRESSSLAPAGDAMADRGSAPAKIGTAATNPAGNPRRGRDADSGTDAGPVDALRAKHPSAPLPPSWQSLLPGAIRL